jgi:hypothetical protein|tara:strand:- start:1271 stop:2266 length:996 start_codon:yes stop_codon:yes gene_type:complete
MKKTVLLITSLVFITYNLFSQPIDAVKIFKKSDPSVVVVIGYNKANEIIAQGSGFLIDSLGTIVTNFHVITDAHQVKIETTNDKTFLVNSVIGVNKILDIAILQSNGLNDSNYLLFGNSELVEVGEDVIAIGSPQGLENTLSKGIVSGIRKLEDGAYYIQTTTPISGGSSGGPLINSHGEVIGITTFLIQSGQNLNFCIPINFVKPILQNPNKIAFHLISEHQRVSISDLLGLWQYETVCPNCLSKKALGTIYVSQESYGLVLKGHITYSNGTEFTWVEDGYTDGNQIWSYVVNDKGDIGLHIFNIISDKKMESNWIMSNGVYGTAISIKH